jgi:hypothetical protein
MGGPGQAEPGSDGARIAASGAIESSGSPLGRDGWSRLGETVLVSAPEGVYAKTGTGSIGYQVVGTGPPDVVATKPAFLPVDLMWDEPRLVQFLNGRSSFNRRILVRRPGDGLLGLDRAGRESCTECGGEDWIRGVA